VIDELSSPLLRTGNSVVSLVCLKMYLL
jgi:hypothetical protein